MGVIHCHYGLYRPDYGASQQSTPVLEPELALIDLTIGCISQEKNKFKGSQWQIAAKDNCYVDLKSVELV